MSHSGTLRVAIVDGEPLARSLLVRLCRTGEAMEVVAQADSGAAALQAIRAQRPDVVLLDVELPDMTGFELLRSLQGGVAPLVIIVTAHAQHAITAFEAGAVDYLVKPVRADRFHEAIARARGRREPAIPGITQPSLRPPEPTDLRGGAAGRPQLLAGERERRLYLLDPEKIDYIESYGNYVRIWAGAASYISRDCVKELALLLAPAGFVRVQRSKLVNLHAVAYIERPGHGVFLFTLTSGTRLESTSTYRADILRALYPSDLSKRQVTTAELATRSRTPQLRNAEY
jgi:two-component system LytT family response regulator